MGLFDMNYNFDKLVRLTSSGVEVSSFVQIKNALIKRYKEIYGNDIDIDSTTADGQYIMMLSLLLYNGYNGLLYLNNNLDPACATGKFLDVLCGLNNIFREQANHSYAYLYVKYIGKSSSYNSTIGDPESKTQIIQCIDQNGNIWTWTEGKGADSFPTTFSADDTRVQILKFECEEPGAVEAYADESLSEMDQNQISYSMLNSTNHGDINAVLDINTYPFEVWQAEDAVVGNDEESDESLRQRLIMERGNTGLTVANGVLGSLLGIMGVQEAKLYNSVEEGGIVAKDETSIEKHNVYIVLRYKENANMDAVKDLIGETINNKLTPGIVTTEYNDGDEGLYGIPQEVEISSNLGLQYSIFWKQCKPVYPAMRLYFKANKNLYDQAKSEEAIIKTLKDYIFALTIYDDINMPDVLSQLNTCDTLINNQHTFMFYNGAVSDTISTGVYTGNNTTFENKDTYYSYNDFVDYKTKYVEIVVTDQNELDDLIASDLAYIYDETISDFEMLETGAIYDPDTTYYTPNETQPTKIYKFTKGADVPSSPYDDWQLDLYFTA